MKKLDTKLSAPSEVQNFLKLNPELASLIRSTLEVVIKGKIHSFRPDNLPPNLEELISNSIVKKIESVEIYEICYESMLVQQTMLWMAEETMGTELPIDIFEALDFAKQFIAEIREPSPRTFWYSGNPEGELKQYILLYLQFERKIDVIDTFLQLQPTESGGNNEFWDFDNAFCGVLPFIDPTLKQLDQVIEIYFKKEGWENSILIALGEWAKVNAQSANSYLLQLEQLNKFQLQGVLIIALYPSNPNHYFRLVLDLLAKSQLYGINTIAWLEYQDKLSILMAYETIVKIKQFDLRALRCLPAFYTNILKNSCIDSVISAICFNQLSQLIRQKVDDAQYHRELEFRIKMIDGFDDEKFQLLPAFLSEGRATVIQSIFDNFSSARYIFQLMKLAYTSAGRNVDFEQFEPGLRTMASRDRNGFEVSLIDFLTSDMAILRHVATRILTKGFLGSYEFEIGNLGIAQQLMAVDSLLSFPALIEQLLPLALQFRFSEFPEVGITLTSKMLELIRAFDHHLIELCSKVLDSQVDTDQDLLSKLKNALEQIDKERNYKAECSELDPFRNDVLLTKMYFQLENEEQAESMEMAADGSFLRQLFRNINVIRGSGFKTEQNPEITMMNKISHSMVVDRRYYLNPDKYEWQFRQYIDQNSIDNI